MLVTLTKMPSRTDFDLYLNTSRGIIRPASFKGAVYLIQNEDFGIVLVNNSDLKTKSKVYLSGHELGTVVLKPRENFVLQKPVKGVDRKFRYTQFGSYEAVMGKLNKENLYSNEITAVFMPEKLRKQKQPIYAAAGSSFGGIPVKSDSMRGYDTVDNPSGCGVLGPNKSFQKFFRVDDFETCGKYYFTLVMQTKCEDDYLEILPLCDMYTTKFNV